MSQDSGELPTGRRPFGSAPSGRAAPPFAPDGGDRAGGYQPAPGPGISPSNAVPLPPQETRVPGATLAVSPPHAAGPNWGPPQHRGDTDRGSDPGGDGWRREQPSGYDDSAGYRDQHEHAGYGEQGGLAGYEEHGQQGGPAGYEEHGQQGGPAGYEEHGQRGAYGGHDEPAGYGGSGQHMASAAVPQPRASDESMVEADEPAAGDPAGAAVSASASVPLASRVMPPTDYARPTGPAPQPRLYGRPAEGGTTTDEAADRDRPGGYDQAEQRDGHEPEIPAQRASGVYGRPATFGGPGRTDAGGAEAPDAYQRPDERAASPAFGAAAPFGDLVDDDRDRGHQDDSDPYRSGPDGYQQQNDPNPFARDAPEAYQQGRPDTYQQGPNQFEPPDRIPYDRGGPEEYQPGRPDQPDGPRGFQPGPPRGFEPGPDGPRGFEPGPDGRPPAPMPFGPRPDQGPAGRPDQTMVASPFGPGPGPMNAGPMNAGPMNAGPMSAGPVSGAGAGRAVVPGPGPDFGAGGPATDPDQERFNSFQGQPPQPANEETPPTPHVRNGRVLAAVLAAAVLLLLIPLGAVWLFTRGGDDAAFQPAVGDCVKQDGNTAAQATCGDAGSFKVTAKVPSADQCPDQQQPSIAVEEGGNRQVLCLEPASG
ncbi:hypothetical protein [Plantactinospora sp. GCM10030261]|uniref:LppU/SCO3897 family protein n=1 Tax=Plantactinospora sp. GCM10030261 TaxID=3273420 RepID=UPI0036085B72